MAGRVAESGTYRMNGGCCRDTGQFELHSLNEGRVTDFPLTDLQPGVHSPIEDLTRVLWAAETLLGVQRASGWTYFLPPLSCTATRYSVICSRVGKPRGEHYFALHFCEMLPRVGLGGHELHLCSETCRKIQEAAP